MKVRHLLVIYEAELIMSFIILSFFPPLAPQGICTCAADGKRVMEYNI